MQNMPTAEILPGLSLCIQGTLAQPPARPCLHRFIPVHTGNMIPQTGEHQVPTVYPCAYREHHIIRRSANGVIGVSLCIQGTYQQ